MNFGIAFSRSEKNVRCVDLDHIEPGNYFSMGIMMFLILPTHEHGRFFHVLKSPISLIF